MISRGADSEVDSNKEAGSAEKVHRSTTLGTNTMGICCHTRKRSTYSVTFALPVPPSYQLCCDFSDQSRTVYGDAPNRDG